MKVIAEVGSNIKSLNDCHKSVDLAFSAGADAVKFQYFTKKELYGLDFENDEPLFRTEWVEPVYEHCKKLGFEFMCTAFGFKGYEFINQFVDTHKIASAECTDLDILSKVNSFKKPVYLSTGGASYAQINNALQLLKDCKVTIFYCVPEYPAKVISLETIAFMKETFGDAYNYGYSDHSIDVCYVPNFAKEFGATVIEKHVNFLDYTDTPDCHHSLNYLELKLMCAVIKNQPKAYMDTLGQLLDDNRFRDDHGRKLINLENGEKGYFRKYHG